jgi:uncharacterized protein YcaQ
VARVDLKADRKGRRLLVQAAHFEAGHEASRVAGPLATELQAMASWLGLDETVIVDRGDLARPLGVFIA